MQKSWPTLLGKENSTKHGRTSVSLSPTTALLELSLPLQPQKIRHWEGDLKGILRALRPNPAPWREPRLLGDPSDHGVPLGS